MPRACVPNVPAHEAFREHFAYIGRVRIENVAAEYSLSKKTFKFPKPGYGLYDSERQAIVHESVHAMQDIAGEHFIPREAPFSQLTPGTRVPHTLWAPSMRFTAARVI